MESNNIVLKSKIQRVFIIAIFILLRNIYSQSIVHPGTIIRNL